jgi:recombinational DNA repair ATPase RecF
MRLTKLEVEHFRGYNEPRSFDCLADVVILCGPNGSGKTSFFDALSWGLFGDIRRLRGSRDVVGQAHLRNYFSGEHDPHRLDYASRSRSLGRGRRPRVSSRRGRALDCRALSLTLIA